MNESTIPRLKFPEKFGFFTFSTASNVVYQFKSLYYLFFLTNVLKIDVLAAGLILTIGTIWDAINDPLIGFWSVNHKFKNGERCRPFALWFAVPWALSVVALFCDFRTSQTITVILALVIYFIFESFNTFVAIPYNSMGGLATDRDEDRRSINVYRNLGGCLGSGIGAVACLPLLKVFGALDESGNLIDGSSARGFLLTAMVMGAVCVIGSLAHYFTTRERVRQIADDEDPVSPLAAAKMLLRCRSWVLNMFYIICYGVNNVLIMSSITYYATYVMGSTAAATAIQAVYLVVSIITTLLVGPLDRLLGRKRTMLFGAAVLVLGKIWFVLDPWSTGAIYTNAVTVGIGLAIAFVMFNTNRNNIAGLVEWDSGRRIDSLVSTGDNLAAKLAQAGATQLLTVAMHLSGFNEALPAQPAATLDTINAMLGWVPGLVTLVMLAVLLAMDIEGDMRRMKQEKAARGIPVSG